MKKQIESFQLIEVDSTKTYKNTKIYQRHNIIP